jgi:hypothetical protein
LVTHPADSSKKAAFISGSLRELGMILYVGNDLVLLVFFVGKVWMFMLLRMVTVNTWACMCLLLMSRRFLFHFCQAQLTANSLRIHFLHLSNTNKTSINIVLGGGTTSIRVDEETGIQEDIDEPGPSTGCK